MKIHPENPHNVPTQELVKVIIASCLGSVFEWYDFELFALVAAIIAKHFFSALPESSAFIMALFTFASGLALRPIGALLFGHFGDKIGRKYTFLVTITATGLSTFLIGLLPTYSSIGIAAPILLILLRCTQGLAVGGEYGGAAIYIAEYSPPNRRGLYTGFIQAAAIAGDFTSTIVVICCQLTLGKENFEEWGWRVPFLLSVVLLGISIYIRSKLHETPLFLKMKEAGTRSKAPLTESFTKWKNLRLVILTLFGAVAGQAAVNYASTLYGFFFITQTLKVETLTANLCLSFVSLVCMAFNVLFGYLSDKIGRKPIIMAGCLLGGLTLYPIFLGLTHFLNPDLEHAMRTSPAVVIADPNECSFQFVPSELKTHIKFTSSCDILKNALNKYSVSYHMESAPQGSLAKAIIGNHVVESVNLRNLSVGVQPNPGQTIYQKTKMRYNFLGRKYCFGPKKFHRRSCSSDYCCRLPHKSGSKKNQHFHATRSMESAWNLFSHGLRFSSCLAGNGWIGGFLPTIAFSLVLLTGNIYAGLWYPIIVSLLAFVIGSLFLRETKDVDITRDDDAMDEKFPVIELYDKFNKRS